MSRKYQLSVLAALMVTVSSVATAATNFTYVKTIPNSVRFTSMASDANGALYYVSSSTDGFAYLPDPVNDSVTSLAVTTAGSYGSGNSYAGIGIAPNGTAYAGGKDTASASTYWKGVPNATPATAFTATKLTSLTGLFSGPAAPANNTIVVGNDSDGGLTFYTDGGTALTAVNGTAIGGGVTGAKSLAYDATAGKLYEAGSATNVTGAVNVFTSNGTAAGTSAGTSYIAGGSTSLAATEQGMRYQSVAVSAADHLLAVARNTGSSGTTGWAIYNTVSNQQIDFITLGSGDVPSGTALTGVAGSTGAQQAQGCVFIKKGATTYLGVSSGTGATSKLYLFSYNHSAVADWSMY